MKYSYHQLIYISLENNDINFGFYQIKLKMDNNSQYCTVSLSLFVNLLEILISLYLIFSPMHCGKIQMAKSSWNNI